MGILLTLVTCLGILYACMVQGEINDLKYRIDKLEGKQ